MAALLLALYSTFVRRDGERPKYLGPWMPMKKWEAKTLGFSSAWWFALQAFVVGPAQGPRVACGVVVLVASGLWSMAMALEDGDDTVRTLARWFLLGVGSMIAAMVVGVVLGVLGILR